MGGCIQVDSEVGKGSSFWFDATFASPVQPSLKSVKAKRRVAHLLCQVRGLRVLVVDDNHVNRLIFEKHLAAFGMEVVSVSDALKAIDCLDDACEEGRPYEIAIVDHMMPQMDGEMLRDRIRQDERLIDLRLIISSSSGMVSSRRAARDMGFDAAMPKPVHRRAILRGLSAVLDLDAEEQDEPQGTTQPQSTPEGRWILLVEDNLVNQKLAQTLLAKAGHRITLAVNGIEAVKRAGRNVYDLVLMDVQMPGMDGLEATRQIRNLPEPFASQPIIAMTANAMKGDREKCIQAGMNDYLSKPIDRHELLDKIGYWTGSDDPLQQPGTAVAETALGDDDELELTFAAEREPEVELTEDAAEALRGLMDDLGDLQGG